MTFQYDRSPNDPLAPITYGQDWNFYQKISVTVNGTFNTDCDIVIPFNTQGIQLLNLGSGATEVVEFSMNGNRVHGEMNPTNPSAGLTYDARTVSKLWFRVQTGSTGPVTVSVMAWATPGG
jgi:hypothetical protein